MTVPYDFDLSGLANARYRASAKVVQTRRRIYIGYCDSAAEDVRTALRHIVARKDELLRIAAEIPSVEAKAHKRRMAYLDEFFSEAADENRLLARFRKHCL